MTRRVDYEWVCEHVNADGDIVDPMFADTLAQARSYQEPLIGDAVRTEIALVKHEYTEVDGELGRGYAYLQEDGSLPDQFDGDVDPTIPQRFRKEVL